MTISGSGGADVTPPQPAPVATAKVYYAHLDPAAAPIVVAPGASADVALKTFAVAKDGDYYIIGTATFVGDPAGFAANPATFASGEFDLILDGATAIESTIGTSVWTSTINPFALRFYFTSVAVQGAVHLTAGNHTLSLQASAPAGDGISIEVQFAEISIQPVTSLDAVP